MSQADLVISVYLPDGRYHGMPEWPPSPFRLYQALLAGALLGEPDRQTDSIRAAFEWLERQPAPSISVPPYTQGKRHIVYMPNNDLDTVGGDPRNTARIRGATKEIAPRLLPSNATLSYRWRFDSSETRHGEQIAALADRVHQLGRGVDMAFASGEVRVHSRSDAAVTEGSATVYQPTGGGASGDTLRTPEPGSFTSLIERHERQRQRLHGGTLTQPPPPRYGAALYEARAHRLLFDLVGRDGDTTKYHALSPTHTSWLVRQIRDQLARLLNPSFGQTLVERIIIGRRADEADKTRRIQIIPLPSIGFRYADRAIRRLVLVVPTNCPIPVSEIHWAAGTIHLGVSADGEIVDATQPQLVPATETRMLTHYAADDRHTSSTVWRTVTPLVVQTLNRRTRANGKQRHAHLNRMIQRAIRQAGIDTPVSRIRVQQEPFEQKGLRANAVDLPGHLTGSERHHAEITFAKPVRGPLVVGNGRYMGLGLCAPVVHRTDGAFVFDLPVPLQLSTSARGTLTNAARRALMNRAANNRGSIPPLFSGHAPDGGPSSSGQHEHIFITTVDADGDGFLDRIMVLAPWRVDRTYQPGNRDRQCFEQVVPMLAWLGGHQITNAELTPPRPPDSDERYFESSKVWESETDYQPTIHPKPPNATDTIIRDAVSECARRGLPRPDVDVLNWTCGPRGGNVSARLQLRFGIAIQGPLLLGRGSHYGEGLFGARNDQNATR